MNSITAKQIFIALVGREDARAAAHVIMSCDLAHEVKYVLAQYYPEHPSYEEAIAILADEEAIAALVEGVTDECLQVLHDEQVEETINAVQEIDEDDSHDIREIVERIERIAERDVADAKRIADRLVEHLRDNESIYSVTHIPHALPTLADPTAAARQLAEHKGRAFEAVRYTTTDDVMDAVIGGDDLFICCAYDDTLVCVCPVGRHPGGYESTAWIQERVIAGAWDADAAGFQACVRGTQGWYVIR